MKGVKWTIELYEYGTPDWSTPILLRFPFDEPLLIEWDETAAEEALMGSRATLHVLSPGDRTFIPLYTRETGHVKLEVLRNDAPYWEGTLDTELYEEPYSENEDYEVELTFSDFEAMDHVKPTQSGLHSIMDYLNAAMSLVRLEGLRVDESLITTLLHSTDKASMSLAQVGIVAENFVDEDGEVCSYKEALEEMLVPLGLKMRQRSGKVWVFDLNGAATLADTEGTTWDSDDQVMGVEKAVNKIKITFSPYSNCVITNKIATFSQTVDTNDHGMKASSLRNADYDGITYLKNYQYNDSIMDDNAAKLYRSFNLFYAKETDDNGGFASRGNDNVFFHITPILGNMDACSGIATIIKAGCCSYGSAADVVNCDVRFTTTSKNAFTTKRVYLPPIEGTEATKYLIRIKQEMLLDMRYNPYEEGDVNNEQGNYDAQTQCMNYVFVPAKILLYEAETGGTAIKQYSNRVLMNIYTNTHVVPSIANTKGDWVTPSTDKDDDYLAYLAWYDPSDPEGSSGTGGWKYNRQMTGKPETDLNVAWKDMEEGQYIPYPAEGGWLEMSLSNGYLFQDNKDNFPVVSDSDDYHRHMRWWLWKLPLIDVVKNDLKLSEAKCGDIEYKGVIDAHAFDDLEMDTKCGTRKTTMPTAKGIYRFMSTVAQINSFSRAGWQNQLCEHLLIRTLYSQYATKHLKLNGTIQMGEPGFLLKTVHTEAGKKFLVTASSEDMAMDQAQITMTEISGDEEMTEGLYNISDDEKEDDL